MAKTNGPLFSMDASGKFGGALVYSKWKGRPTVRQLVKPSNPRTAGQETARNNLAATAAAQKWENVTLMKYPGATFRDKIRLRDAAPSGQAWNGYLVKLMLGAGNTTITAGKAAWLALSGPNRIQWDSGASLTVPPFNAVPQYTAGHVPAAAMTNGQVYFLLVYGLAACGLATPPGAVPPAYAV